MRAYLTTDVILEVSFCIFDNVDPNPLPLVRALELGFGFSCKDSGRSRDMSS